VEVTLEVDVDDLVPLVFRELLGGLDDVEAGVVDENVDLAEPLDSKLMSSSQALRSEVSTRVAAASPPAFTISSAVCSACSRVLEHVTTEAPALASPSAIALPKPRPEPVMIATLPDKSNRAVPPSKRPGCAFRFVSISPFLYLRVPLSCRASGSQSADDLLMITRLRVQQSISALAPSPLACCSGRSRGGATPTRKRRRRRRSYTRRRKPQCRSRPAMRWQWWE
jgi:hypothetical protein